MTEILWGVRTNFSIGESIIKLDELIPKAKELGYTHVAIADTMSVSSMITASQLGKKHGIEVIPGVGLRVQIDEGQLVGFTVYPQDDDAMTYLYGLLSSSERTTGRRPESFVTLASFVKMLSACACTVTSGNALSAFGMTLPVSVRDATLAAVRVVSRAFYVEAVALTEPVWLRQNFEALSYAAKHNVPVCWTNAPLWLNEGDSKARDLMNCIAWNYKFSSRAKRVMEGRKQHLLDPERLFDAVFEAFNETQNHYGHLGSIIAVDQQEFVDSTFRWKKLPISLPRMAPDEYRELVTQCKAAWKARIESPVLGYKPDKALLPEYVQRLKYELETLQRLGFCQYFLLVSDIVNWAKSQGIVVGPGRGSVGGSLVAFLLGITEVDPIRFNLLFERFINPERLDLPDADLDFMSERRHEVIEYCRAKYGHDYVANIANYNTLQAPSALREVGKALELPERDYACSSFIPKEHGQSKTLDEAVEDMAELQAFQKAHPEAFKMAKAVEEQMRSMGTHAAGVVVSADRLDTRAVVEHRGDDKVVNWDKRTCEEQGLIKIDVLGLSNLDIIRRATDKIERHYGKKIDLLQQPLDDEKVMTAFGAGDTVAVFQFESSGMRKLLRDLAKGGPLTFEELSAATALYRPGPLDSGLLTDYVNIRQGVSSPYYDHPAMEAALSPTHSVMVYQEQVMQLSRDLAGFTGPQADHLRKAMGKKDKDKMAEMRDKWVEGCKGHSSIDDALAGALFDRIQLFAGYAFNRSHSVEYAVISYWCMWLKVYYPHEFYAATLEIMKEDRLLAIVTDADKRGIRVLAPEINQSTNEFRRLGEHLLAPINRIKGLSEMTERVILEGREKAGGKFKDLSHFLANINKTKCNKRHVEILVRAGTMDGISPPATPIDRTKDQMDLLPGLIIANIRSDRAVVVSQEVINAIVQNHIEACEALGAPVRPQFGRKAKFMVIFEAPSRSDEKVGIMMKSDSCDAIKTALQSVGMSSRDAYFTTMVKTPKKDKQLTPDEVNASRPFIMRELEVIKPPVIVALGAQVAKWLLPDEKGGIMELAGKVRYVRELDANVVVGISPGMVWHDPSKQQLLNDAFRQVADLL